MMRFRNAVAVLLALLLTACADEITLPHTSSGASTPSGSSDYMVPSGDDPGMIMRHGLRDMEAADLIRLVEKSGNVVAVGFRQVGQSWGVSSRGESLVPEAEVQERIETVIAEYSDSLIYEFKGIPAIVVRLQSAEAALALRQLPWIDYVNPSTDQVTPDVAAGSCSALSSPQTVPWNITRVEADHAWSVATGSGAPRKLVLLDDGADEGGGWHSYELHWEVYSFYTASTVEDGNHGTPVLGAAQARDNDKGTVGVAPTAEARVMKIYDPRDTDWEVYTAMAVDDNATLASVMTISYSTKQSSAEPPSTMANLYDAIRNAYYQHGVLFTASTGNQESGTTYAYPAKFDEVIGVGGSDKSDAWIYNNYAPGNVELAAPAIDILSVCKGGTIGPWNGTSFATPMVAGAVMLLREEFPTITPDSLRARLRNTAIPMADARKSGAGRIDVAAALGLFPPLSVSIDGPNSVETSGSYEWEAMPSGGSGSYTYEWYRRTNHQTSTCSYVTDWSLVGTEKIYSPDMAGFYNFDLRVEVSSAGETASHTIFVTVEGAAICPS